MPIYAIISIINHLLLHLPEQHGGRGSSELISGTSPKSQHQTIQQVAATAAAFYAAGAADAGQHPGQVPAPTRAEQHMAAGVLW